MGHYYHKGRRRFTQVKHRGGVEETIVGPHCFLKQDRHPEPFSKSWRATARRDERKFKRQQRGSNGEG